MIKEDIKVVLGVDTLQKAFELKIDYANNAAKLNGEPYKMDTHAFYSDLVPIVSMWEHDMVDKNTIDGISYYVHIFKDGKKYFYDGKNKFPFNFNMFTELLKEYKLW